MNIATMNANMPKEISLGVTDIFDGNMLIKGAEMKLVMVSSYDDLDTIAPLYMAGTIAYTAGFQNKWQLGTDGTWEAI